mgnify:FL=1
MPLTTAEITAWLGTFAWPWIRVSAMLMAAPVFGHVQVPVRLRVFLGVVLAVAMLPAVGEVPAVDPFSVTALMIAVQQVLIGVLIGLLLSIAFQAIVVAGESISLTMGLGFATMVDPQNGSVPVLSQFLIILATLVFLGLGGHLMLIELLAVSFELMPVSADGFARADFLAVAAFAAQMFAGAVLIALPAVTVLLGVQLAMGIMTRAAPQMNIFSVGFPVTMLLGFGTVLFLVLPVLTPRMMALWENAFGLARRLVGG